MQLEEITRFFGLFTDHEQTVFRPRLDRQYNLEQMRALLEALGNPHHDLRAIHVAGTDGKGSTAAMLYHLLRRTGHKVGLFTSPHLESLLERIVIGEGPLPLDRFLEYLARVTEVMGVSLADSVAQGRVVRGAARPMTALHSGYATVFEMLTAVAFLAFAEEKVDVAVVEVGLGGRLDCTNVLRPLVSVVTSIDLDHTDLLGPSVLTIAREKLGIVKPGVPVVVGEQYHIDVLDFARRMLTDHDALCAFVADEWEWGINRRGPDGYEVNARRWTEPAARTFRVGLLGDHQASNAITALTAIELLPADLKEGVFDANLADVQWPGRCELLTPQRGIEPVVLDGAHTAQGAFALRQTLDQLFPGPRAFVLALLQNKNVPAFTQQLLRPTDLIVATAVGNPRSMTPMRLAEQIGGAMGRVYPTDRFHILPATDVASAIMKARSNAPTATLVISGSLYLVGEARRFLLDMRK